MPITLDEYYMGRDKKFASDLTDDLKKNAIDLLERVNQLLEHHAGFKDSELIVSSGWRPPAVNAVTGGASRRSKHMTCQAIDLSDRNRRISKWCLDNLSRLEEEGLYLEDPAHTPTWCHLQSVPPKSKRRVFKP